MEFIGFMSLCDVAEPVCAASRMLNYEQTELYI